MKKTVSARFWEKVSNHENGCWEWTSGLSKWGYGEFTLNGKTWKAHRVSWLLTHGVEPALFVLHKCDNRKCVNPEHLFLGTCADNLRDMSIKGRGATGDRNVARRPGMRQGDRNGRAKLSSEQVLEIRALHSTGKHTQKALASMFGVSKSTISYVVNLQHWGHV